MSHGTHKELSASNFVPGEPLARASRVAFGICVAGLALSGWLASRDGDMGHVLKVYLTNFLFVLTLCLGGLLFCLIQHLTRAGWSAAVRRPAEILASNLQWIWILFLPFVALAIAGERGAHTNLGTLWPWADLAHMAEHDPAEAHIVQAKSGYLNQTFFFIRAAAYFLIWAWLGRTMLRLSQAQDSAGPKEAAAISARLSRIAAPGIILFALSITFAAFDWIMSLSPAWFSTMFGVYFFCGICTGGYSLIALIVMRLRHLGVLREVVTPEHLQDLGKMIFAFGVVFWAYIAFSQYMLIWYGSIPEETTWFLARQVGGWGPMSIFLLFGHFVVPFVFLISRWIKRWDRTLMIGAAWMMLMQWIDLYWLVMPVIPADVGTFDTYDAFASAYAGTRTGLSDPLNWTMLVGLLCLMSSISMARLSRRPALCVHDPRLPESLAFQNI